MRNSTARRRKRVPMSNRSTTSDTRWYTRQRYVPPYVPPDKLELLRTPSSNLWCESAPELRTAEQYYKIIRTKFKKNDLRRSDRSKNTYQDFMKIRSLWAAALETRRNCFSNVILSSRVTQYNKVIRLLQDSSIQSWWGWLGMNCAWPGDYQSISLTRF